MRIIGLTLIISMISLCTFGQSWQVLQRTHNNLIPLSGEELQEDTLRLSPGKYYEIDLPDLFDQETGKLQKKLYVQNLADAAYLDLEISHEQSIIDLADTVYMAKVRFEQIQEYDPEKIKYPAKIVVRNNDGSREKELVLLPTPSVSQDFSIR